MLKLIILTSLINFHTATDTIPYVDSQALLESFSELYEQEAYDQIISDMKLIGEADSNYVKAQNLLMLTYGKNGQLAEADALGKKLQESGKDLSADFYVDYGNLFINEDRFKEAIAVYEKGLEVFPYEIKLIYNTGYSLMKLEEYDRAIPFFQRCVKIDPYYENAHRMLGAITSFAGMRTRSLLSFFMGLAINPDHNASLVMSNNMVNDASKNEGQIRLKLDNAAFEVYDQLIKSNVALDDRYESKVNFNAPIAQQGELLLNSLEYTPNTGDFWMDYYVPMFQAMAQKELTSPFMYFMLTSTGKERVTKWLANHEKEKEQWIEVAQQYLAKNQDFLQDTVKKAPGVYEFWYYNDNTVSAVGDKDGETFVGPWLWVGENGRITSHGTFNKEGKRTGKWHYYHPNGQLESIEDFGENEELVGELLSYNEDGTLSSRVSFKDGKKEGEWIYYNQFGTQSGVYDYAKNMANGLGKSYYVTGELNREYEVKDDLFEGYYKTFYRNGQMSNGYQYAADTLSGPYKGFYADGKLSLEGDYEDDNETGTWKKYYRNGQVAATGVYRDGQKYGEWTYYYEDGNKSQTETYDEEQLVQGEVKAYWYDGSLAEIKTYKDDQLVASRAFGPDGEEWFAAKIKNGKMPYRTYYMNGQLRGEGVMENDQLQGEYTIYFPNGLVFREGVMKDDGWKGLMTEYRSNGTVFSKSSHQDGMTDGYMQYYREDGQVQSEGWHVKDERQQEWRDYHPDGTLSMIRNYKDNQYHGDVSYFDYKGRIINREYYEEGILLKETQYDTLGKPFNEVEIPKTGGQYVLKYVSGEQKIVYQFLNGQIVDGFTQLRKNGDVAYRYKMDGPVYQSYQGFFRNGQLNAEGGYLAGSLDGQWSYYTKEGKLSSEVDYQDGETHGKSVSYHDNGETEYVRFYREGKSHGTGTYYDWEGNWQLVKFYDKDAGLYAYQVKDKTGKLMDPVKFDDSGDVSIQSYYENGQVAVSQQYKRGGLDGESIYYAANGQVMSKTRYVKGTIQGESVAYHPNGKLKTSTQYKDDYKHGKELIYHTNGQKRQEFNWIFGKLEGWSYSYDENGQLVEKRFYRNDEAY